MSRTDLAPRQNAPRHIPPGILETVTRTVLGRSGVERGAEITFRCPVPRHPDEHPSARWNLCKGTWYCDVCKIGGSALDLADRLGIEMPVRRPRPSRTPARRIAAVYPYHRADGTLLFEVVRYEPKDFRQRRPDGAGGWLWNLHGIEPVLYHLPQLLSSHDKVVLVEGEKDADRLRECGLIATTSPMGAGKWHDGYTATLAGREVVILPDDDDPGRAHAQKVAAQLHAAGCTVQVVTLSGLPEHGDVSDWLDLGFTVDDLIELIHETPVWTPDDATPDFPPVTDIAPRSFALTDTGNAERLVARFGQHIRYNYDRGIWLVWNGTHWAEDQAGRMEQLAKSAVRAIPEEVATLAGDGYRRTLKWALASESARARAAMIDLARSEVGIPVESKGLDADPWLLNCQNGTLNLRTGQLRDHDPDDLITRLMPVEYDPDTRCPTFLTFLDRVFAQDAELIAYVQQMLGYSLTGSTREQVIFIAHGTGANGKSTLLATIATLLADYAAHADTDSFLQRDRDGIGDQRRQAALRGARQEVHGR
jgi:putative DNA primase/helicase